MKSIPQTPKKLLSNWVGKPFQAILLIIFLIWTPLLIAETLDVQQSCHPMIDWDHPVREECVPPSQDPVAPPSPPSTIDEILGRILPVITGVKDKMAEGLDNIVQGVKDTLDKPTKDDTQSTPVAPPPPEPNLIEKFKNLFNISSK